MTNAWELFYEPQQQAGRALAAVPSLTAPQLNHLRVLESESIYILREAAAEFARPVMLYSIGKDSSVLLRLAQKAFYPGKIPFPLLHIDTSYKFPEMIAFRDSYPRQIGAELIVHKNQEALDSGANPYSLGTQNCCGLLNGCSGVGYDTWEFLAGEKTQKRKCRMRSLGCVPCTGAIRSDADTLPKIIEEMISFRRSERENRAIDHDEEGSMELKKREGYF